MAEQQHHPRIPVSTYRLQFNRQFTFKDAREIVPYLHQLGITDCYASPYFQARAESLHGYDITDHNKLNAAIGTRPEYDGWIAALHEHGIGQLYDFVPNHMGIGESLNSWWVDVLENGPSSVYAPYFDIDWRPLKSDLHDKVLLPILGDQYGRVLERGELKLRYESGAFYLHYYEHAFPIAPRSYRDVLELALRNLEPHKDQDFYAELQSIMTALEYLPLRTETDPERIAERAREKEIIKRRLDRRCQEAPELLHAIEAAVEEINGTASDSRSFDALDRILNEQAYRLAFWRVAAEEINYRRFFDINDLAAIRMEVPEVFKATHRLLLELVGKGAITGLRIDHPDGLYLPHEYFEKLQGRCAKALGKKPPHDRRSFYLLLEKILTGDEHLRRDWPVHGTTGYDFASQAAGLLVDQSAETSITSTFKKFIGHNMHFGHLAYAKKRLTMRISLANDVNVLGSMLDRLSEQNRWFRDFTLDALNRAVRETIACFPVYRTYVSPDRPVAEEDRLVIERAIAAAKRRNPALEGSVFDFLRDILLLRLPENLEQEERKAHLAFVLKFQQATGPITAKGIEDTVFYIYNRLVALNDVGSEPYRFGLALHEFHDCNTRRQRDWPHSLLTTSTHDTKRSEDVRARIAAISELADTWRRALTRWRTATRRFKSIVEESEAPDANEEYLLYQTLLGTWQVDELGRPADSVSDDYVERIRTYMAKALKEAKLNTSWVRPHEAWDKAMSDFIGGILQRGAKNKFIPQFLPMAEEIARLGAINSLSQTIWKLTAPGVPDIYQGTETWDDSLVDPDNRRRVDYGKRRELLASLTNYDAAELLRCWGDGRIKMLVTTKLLHLRRNHPELFSHGSYVPLTAAGTHNESVVAYARKRDGEAALVITPRLSSRVGFPPIGDKWQDTAVDLTNLEGVDRMRDVFTGASVPAAGGTVPLAQVLQTLPFAVFA